MVNTLTRMDSRMNDNLDRFDQALSEFQIELSQKQRNQFLQFYEILTEWNSFMNLTAITDFQEVIDKHFIDSLSIVKVIKIDHQKMIDLGTGAGFPGIPLKIVYPDIKITLVDSLNKRVHFLNHVIEELGLKDIDSIHGRAEDIARMINYREQYDLCVSRAVANLSSLCEYCLPFVKQNGFFISYKSENIEMEIKQAKYAINECGGSLENVVPIVLPNTKYGRNIICIKKVKGISKKYPRKAGLPTKEPLNKK